MKSFEGIISAGDVFNETLVIKCHKGIAGAKIAQLVVVIPVDPDYLTSIEFNELINNLRQKYKKTL